MFPFFWSFLNKQEEGREEDTRLKLKTTQKRGLARTYFLVDILWQQGQSFHGEIIKWIYQNTRDKTDRIKNSVYFRSTPLPVIFMNLRRSEQMFIFTKHSQKWLKISRHRYPYNVSTGYQCHESKYTSPIRG